MIRISWVERHDQREVLTRMNKQLEVLKEVKRRKINYLGHIMRGKKYEIVHLIIQEKIVGKRLELEEEEYLACGICENGPTSQDSHDVRKVPIIEKLHDEEKEWKKEGVRAVRIQDKNKKTLFPMGKLRKKLQYNTAQMKIRYYSLQNSSRQLIDETILFDQSIGKIATVYEELTGSSFFL